MDVLFEFGVIHGAFELFYLLCAYVYFRLMSNYLLANDLTSDSPAEYGRAVLKLAMPTLVVTAVLVPLHPDQVSAAKALGDGAIHWPAVFERLTLVTGLSLFAINDASKR